MQTAPRRGIALGIALATLFVAGCDGSSDRSTPPPASDTTYQVSIDRTTYGVPHIRAENYGSLGYGQGYAIAEDNLCVLADAFVTFRGERSLHFGPANRPAASVTFGRPLNLDADFFFRFIIDADTLDTFRDAQPPALQELVDGFTAGYNRYLREIGDGAHEGRHADCRDAEWLVALDEDDLYRRLIALNLAASGANWIAETANAQPPAPELVKAGEKDGERGGNLELAVDPDRFLLGREFGIGSNTFAFGSDATGTGSGLAFANPHWYLEGVDRFYQQHLSIPGEIEMSGAAIMGVPLVLIGFNDQVAWAHTVSTARRFGIYELTLSGDSATRYVVDGEERDLTPTTITVALQDGGEVSRTMYRSEYGPMVDLSGLNAALAWSGSRAYTMRDVNLENHRSFANFLAWNQASSLDEFIAAQRALVAIPWVNTAAAGRDDGRAYYADVTAVPNVPADLVTECTAQPFGPAVGQLVPGLPFLDGSRSDCAWRTDSDSAQTGAFGAGNLPSLERADYVANMNDSHWLSNPAEPLTGYARVLGAENTTQSLRTRMGHTMAQERLAGADGLDGTLATSENVREIVLSSRAYSAELLKDELLDAACDGTPISVSRDSATNTNYDPPLEVDVGEACTLLAAWDNTGNLDARGALIWQEYWRRASGQSPYATPFDPADPIDTPRGLNTGNPALIEALGAAVNAITANPAVELDSPVRAYQRYPKAGTDIPLFGGAGGTGYFTVLNNTYMHVVDFPEGESVRAFTFLTHSQSTDPASPHYADYTEAYSDKAWHRMPFTAEEIEAERISRIELEE